MRNYNITNGKFDIDRLHNIFLNGLDGEMLMRCILEEGPKIYPITDNDCCFQWYDAMDGDIDKRIFDSVTKAYSANGMGFYFKNL